MSTAINNNEQEVLINSTQCFALAKIYLMSNKYDAFNAIQKWYILTHLDTIAVQNPNEINNPVVQLLDNISEHRMNLFELGGIIRRKKYNYKNNVPV